ncbi:MAG: hypothetical protein IKX45_06750 [Bacteroidales bacterium]|nr:hypothetical protein [Bacteroidales bacterium]
MKDVHSYEAPSTTVVELKSEGLICNSQVMTMFLLTEDPATEVSFDRGDYGSASIESWE